MISIEEITHQVDVDGGVAHIVEISEPEPNMVRVSESTNEISIQEQEDRIVRVSGIPHTVEIQVIGTGIS